MFSSLQSKLEAAFKRIRGRSVLRKEDIDLVMKEVRTALLEADVNFKVAKEFCNRVAEKSQGEAVLKSLSPDQMVIKIVHEELVRILGGETAQLNLKNNTPAIILMVGLQGSGKTTTSGKLALLLKKEYKKRPYLIPADVYRPAAIQQLKTLGAKLEVPVYDTQTTQDPVEISTLGVKQAALSLCDIAIIDTAGRLQIDQELMQELKNIVAAVNPHEILLVADCMTGQVAVDVAKGFDQAINISGLVLTKLDGDARGGAALSMREVTGKPIKFIGVGEKLDALETYHPDRMASRILGMGDVLSLIEKAAKEVKIEDAEQMGKKLKKGEFGFDDFLTQLRMVKRMGSFGSLAGMIPGMGKMMEKVDPELAEREMKRVEAIILSMTPKERSEAGIINGSRRKRIAKGSGTSVEEVNRLLKQFLEMKRMISKVSKMGLGGLKGMLGGAGGLGGILGKMR